MSDMATRNEFLRAPILLLRERLEARTMDWETGYRVLQMLEQIPIQAAYCPCCADQFDSPDGEVPPPTVVKLRSCGHWSCDRCARHCSDSGCANDGCADCMTLCEGHDEPHCHEHTVAKCCCADCCPAQLVKDERRPAYCYEMD